MVAVSVTGYDASDPLDLSAFPGDFTGVQTGGTEIPIKSYGWIDVQLKDDAGNPLQLAPGSSAQITVPVPSTLLSTAPSTIPLWYFDYADGKWKEEGSATLNGSVYIGSVSHFTPWNCDASRGCGLVQGRVVDGDGMAVPGADIRITGPGWIQRAYTRSDGTWGPVCVEPGAAFAAQAFKGSARSTIINGNGPANGNSSTLPDMILVGDPKIVIALTWGSDPGDLDAHLTFPGTSTNREHVYFGNTMATGAFLDTDDQSSFGPEVITVSRLIDGVYRYSVHHYSGSGTIASSSLQVVMTVQGQGVYSSGPPAAANGPSDAWAVWDITVSGGVVTGVQFVNTLRPMIGAGDVTGFSP
jgi:hypothetical protein